MIPPHFFFTENIFHFLEQNDYTSPKCGELSEYTTSAHTEVEDPCSRWMSQMSMTDAKS